jgi:hypothetical protein
MNLEEIEFMIVGMTKEETINYFYELQILNVHRYAQEVVVCR